MAIRKRIAEALGINVSNEKLVSFLNEDFLDLASLRTGKFKRNDSKFEVCEPFREVMSILEFKAGYKMINIDLTFKHLEETMSICCDKRRIMQVTLNLLSNAIKFTPQRGKITVQVRLIKGIEGEGVISNLHP